MQVIEAIASKHYLQVTEDHFAKAVQYPVQQAHAPTGKKRQKPLTGRGLCEIVRLLAMWCQRPVWRGQDSSERRFPRETGTLPARALQKAVHLMQPIKSLMRSCVR